MKTYTVKEISEILGTSQETVRRWIREGRLNAERSVSRKEGNSVSENDLRAFLESTPKYAGIAAATIAAAPVISAPLTLFGVAATTAAAAAAAVAGAAIKEKRTKEARVELEELVSHLMSEKRIRQESIDKKLAEMASLETEIQALESQIKAIDAVFEQIKTQ